MVGLTLGVMVGLFSFAASRASAQGYVDPGTTSYVFQLALAGVFAALYAARVFWVEVRAAVGRWLCPRKVQQ